MIPATPGIPPFNTVFPFITTASFTGNPTQYVFNVPPGNLNLGVNLNTTIGLVGNPVAPSGQNVAGKNWGFTFWSDGAGNDLFRWFAINPGVDSLNPGDSMTLDLFSTARPGAAGGAFPDPPAIQDVFVSFDDTMGDVSDAVEDTQEFPILEDKCAGSKGKSAGKTAAALLNCYSKAANSGTMVDAECLNKATTKFDSSSQKVDSKDDETDPEDACIAGTGDEAVVEPIITAYVEDIADDLDPAFPAGTPTESKCTAGKLKCAGKKAAAVLKCYTKSLSKGNIVDPGVRRQSIGETRGLLQQAGSERARWQHRLPGGDRWRCAGDRSQGRRFRGSHRRPLRAGDDRRAWHRVPLARERTLRDDGHRDGQ